MKRPSPTTTSVAISLACIGILPVVLTACGSGSSSSTTTVSAPTGGSGPPASTLAPIHGKYSPKIDPANFVTTIDNRYWPLKPGTTYHYKGIRGTTPQTDDETVTNQTQNIIGVPSTAVRDVVSEHGKPVERTVDYYAQDKYGNVW